MSNLTTANQYIIDNNFKSSKRRRPV